MPPFVQSYIYRASLMKTSEFMHPGYTIRLFTMLHVHVGLKGLSQNSATLKTAGRQGQKIRLTGLLLLPIMEKDQFERQWGHNI